MGQATDYQQSNTSYDASGLNAAIKQLLTFTLSDRYFCIELGQIKEIRAYTAPTELPNSMDFLSGVINIRGVVVPIYDLRKRFGLSKEDDKTALAQKVIIVVHLDGQDVGILVDAVSDIIYEDAKNIKHSASTEMSIKGEFIDGIVINNEKVIMLLSIAKLFGEAAMRSLNALSTSIN